MVVRTLNDDSLGKITYDNENSLLTLKWLEATKDDCSTISGDSLSPSWLYTPKEIEIDFH